MKFPKNYIVERGRIRDLDVRDSDPRGGSRMIAEALYEETVMQKGPMSPAKKKRHALVQHAATVNGVRLLTDKTVPR